MDTKYGMLIEAIEINRYSVSLLKAYCFAAISFGFVDYADMGYMRLYELLSKEEMNSFEDEYYEAKQKRKSEMADWDF